MKQWPLAPRAVILYDEGTAPALVPEELADYATRTIPGLKVETRAEYVQDHLGLFVADERARRSEELSLTIAASRASGLEEPAPAKAPLPVEVDYERRRLADPRGKGAGILYHGFVLQSAYGSLLAPARSAPVTHHVVFTDRLLATRGEADVRLHARAGGGRRPYP